MAVSRKNPWNIVNFQVYALSTLEKAPKANMNICTYVTKVSANPKFMAIAIQKHTKTFENLKTNPKCILQYLSYEDIDLVRTLGYKSGRYFDKLKGLEDRLMYDERALPYLKTAISAIWLEVFKWDDFGGDHVMAFFRISKMKNLNPTKKPLTYEDLRQKGFRRT
jgi:flavin reductase (DIM6/NTAB) family NADH-FMN oxidoreductase RutF